MDELKCETCKYIAVNECDYPCNKCVWCCYPYLNDVKAEEMNDYYEEETCNE